MAFPTLQSLTTYSDSTAQATHCIPMPACLCPCDLLVTVFNGGNALQGPITVNCLPAGWTIHANGTMCNPCGFGRSLLMSKKASGCETAAQVVLATSVTATAITARITGWGGTLACDVDTNKIQTGGTNPNPPSVTAGWGACCNLAMVFLSAGDDDATVSVYPACYTCGTCIVTGAGTNFGGESAFAKRNVTGATEDPGAFTLSQSEGFAVMTVIVKPGCAGGGGGGPLSQAFPAASIYQSTRNRRPMMGR